MQNPENFQSALIKILLLTLGAHVRSEGYGSWRVGVGVGMGVGVSGFTGG